MCTQVLLRARGKHRRRLEDNIKFGLLGIGGAFTRSIWLKTGTSS